jgi:hypothetical protein
MSDEHLTAEEQEERDLLLTRLRQVRRAALYEESEIVWKCKERRLWRGHGTWADFCRSAAGLDMDDSVADEYARIHEAVQEITAIAVPRGGMPPLPTRRYCWRPIVSQMPTVHNPHQVAEILELAQELAGPGRAVHWAEVNQAKEEVLGRPQKQVKKKHKSGWFPGCQPWGDEAAAPPMIVIGEGDYEDEAPEGEYLDHLQDDFAADEIAVTLPRPPPGVGPTAVNEEIIAWMDLSARRLAGALGPEWLPPLLDGIRRYRLKPDDPLREMIPFDPDSPNWRKPDRQRWLEVD